MKNVTFNSSYSVASVIVAAGMCLPSCCPVLAAFYDFLRATRLEHASKRCPRWTHCNNTKTKLHGLSPRANYTDRATATCRRSDCQLFQMVPRGQRDGTSRPYSRFSRQEPLLFYQVAPQLYSRGWPTTFFSGSAENRTRASGFVAKNSTTIPQRRSCNNTTTNNNNSVALVRKWTIPTERPALVGEVSANFWGYRGVHALSPRFLLFFHNKPSGIKRLNYSHNAKNKLLYQVNTVGIFRSWTQTMEFSF
jgi:hypothetical protein